MTMLCRAHTRTRTRTRTRTSTPTHTWCAPTPTHTWCAPTPTTGSIYVSKTLRAGSTLCVCVRAVGLHSQFVAVPLERKGGATKQHDVPHQVLLQPHVAVAAVKHARDGVGHARKARPEEGERNTTPVTNDLKPRLQRHRNTVTKKQKQPHLERLGGRRFLEPSSADGAAVFLVASSMMVTLGFAGLDLTHTHTHKIRTTDTFPASAQRHGGSGGVVHCVTSRCGAVRRCKNMAASPFGGDGERRRDTHCRTADTHSTASQTLHTHICRDTAAQNSTQNKNTHTKTRTHTYRHTARTSLRRQIKNGPKGQANTTCCRVLNSIVFVWIVSVRRCVRDCAQSV